MTYRKLRSALTVVGMLIGISTIVFLVSFAFGIEKLVKNEISNGNAMQLLDVGTGNSQIVKLNNEAIGAIGELTDVRSIETIANIAAMEKNSNKEKTLDIPFFVVSKNYLGLSGYSIKYGSDQLQRQDGQSASVLINEGLLESLKIEKGQGAIGKKIKLDLVVPKQITASEATTFSDLEFEVGAIVDGNSASGIFLFQDQAQDLPINNYSQLKVSVESASKIEAVQKQIEGLGFKTEYIGETVKQVEQVFNLFKMVLAGFGAIALTVAGLGMLNTLTISLLKRTKEVALLKIIGVKSRDIRNIFLAEAVTMGIFGGIIGVLFGYFLSIVINRVINTIALNSGGDPSTLFLFPFWFVSLVVVFAITTGLLTGVYPAVRASKINPLDVIRYE